MTKKNHSNNQPLTYEICVQGHINQKRSGWFENLEISYGDNGTSILSGKIIDQSALHSILIKIRDMNLPLITVQQIKV